MDPNARDVAVRRAKMKKKILTIGVGILALVAVTTVIAFAAGALQLPWDNAMGAGSGGSLDTSASYTLIGSLTGAVETNAISTNYKLCSGFICGEFPTYMFLPLISN
jgi:hypothetical protein